MLCSKLELQKQARTKVHEDGFAYKKKSSRSKEFGSASGRQPKQERTSQDFRQKRIEQLQEDLREVDIQVSYAAKQRERCANVKEFSKALDVSKELDELRKKKRKYQEELTLLQRKESVTKRVKKCRDSKKGGKAAPQADLHQFLKPVGSVEELAKGRNKEAMETEKATVEVDNKDVTEIKNATMAVDDQEVTEIEKVLREAGELAAAHGQATEQEKRIQDPVVARDCDDIKKLEANKEGHLKENCEDF